MNKVEAAFFKEDDSVATMEESLTSQLVSQRTMNNSSEQKGIERSAPNYSTDLQAKVNYISIATIMN